MDKEEVIQLSLTEQQRRRIIWLLELLEKFKTASSAAEFRRLQASIYRSEAKEALVFLLTKEERLAKYGELDLEPAEDRKVYAKLYG